MKARARNGGGRLGSACAAAFMVADAAAAAAPAASDLAYPTETFLDFYGSDAMVAPALNEALESLIEEGLVEVGPYLNNRARSAAGLLEEIGVALDREELRLAAPALCAANRHICTPPTTWSDCAEAGCLRLRAAPATRREAAVACARTGSSANGASPPKYVLCAPVLRFEVYYTSMFAPDEASAADLAALATQLGGCEDPQSDEASARVCADIESGRKLKVRAFMPVRRARLRVPVADQSAMAAVDDWYARFAASRVWPGGDLRPDALRLQRVTPTPFGDRQTPRPAGGAVRLECPDCLNPEALAAMNAAPSRWGAEQRKALAAKYPSSANDRPPALVIEKRGPFKGANDPYLHCALRAGDGREIVEVQSRSARRLESRTCSSQTRLDPGRSNAECRVASAPVEDKCAPSVESPSAMEPGDHALAVVGILAGSDYMDAAPGIMPGARSILIEYNEQGDTTADDLSKQFQELANYPPVVVNISSGRTRTTDTLFFDFHYKNLIQHKNKPTLIVAAAGNGPAADNIRRDSDDADFNAGLVFFDRCDIEPACYSVKPLALPGDQRLRAENYFVSVVGTDRSGRWPIGADAATSDEPCDASGRCGFHGPVFDVAAIGVARAPAIVRPGGGTSFEFAYRNVSGSSFAAPFVSGLVMAMSATFSRNLDNYPDTNECSNAKGIKNEVISGYFKSLAPAKLIRDRILSTADYWPGNFKWRAVSTSALQPGNAGPAGAPDRRFQVFSQFAQFGRVDFDAAISGNVNDCIREGTSGVCADGASAFRMTTAAAAKNPLFGAQEIEAPANYPAAILLKAGVLENKGMAGDRDDAIQNALDGTSGLVLPVADIRRIERLKLPEKYKNSSGAPPHVKEDRAFRVVFVDRYDSESPFALRQILAAEIAKPDGEAIPQNGKQMQQAPGGEVYSVFPGLPVTTTIGSAPSRVIGPAALWEFVARWPAECGGA